MDIYNQVADRLTQLGYTADKADGSAIRYATDSAAVKIRDSINRSEIPDGLLYVWIDMSAGLFLRDRKQSGQTGGLPDFTAPAKSITEGDVSVTFAGAADGNATPEERFDRLISSLVKPPDGVFARYRRMAW